MYESSHPRIENYLFSSLVTGLLNAVALVGVQTEHIIYRSSECATECLRHWAGERKGRPGYRRREEIPKRESILRFVSMYMKTWLIKLVTSGYHIENK